MSGLAMQQRKLSVAATDSTFNSYKGIVRFAFANQPST